MIKYEGRKYSVPTRYIGKRMNDNVISNTLHIYYNGEEIICHPVSRKMYNYTPETAYDILKSDAMKNRSDEDIMKFVQQTLHNMDKFMEDD